jgi:hypothetical protein
VNGGQRVAGSDLERQHAGHGPPRRHVSSRDAFLSRHDFGWKFLITGQTHFPPMSEREYGLVISAGVDDAAGVLPIAHNDLAWKATDAKGAVPVGTCRV